MSELCISCGGKGFKSFAKGKVLARSDMAVKAELYQINHCFDCGGTGVEPKRFNYISWFVWALIGMIVGYLMIFSS